MRRWVAVVRKPIFILAVILPIALIAELVILEGIVGISVPGDRGSAVSSYEIREKGKALHFITRNKRFSIVDLWSRNGSAVEALVLRESFEMIDRTGSKGPKHS